MMETIHSSETSILTKATRHNISENGILHRQSREKPEILHCFVILIIYQQFLGYKVEKKLHLLIREQKRLTTTGLTSSTQVKFTVSTTVITAVDLGIGHLSEIYNHIVITVRHLYVYIFFEICTEVTMKNALFRNMKTQLIPRKKHIISPPQSPARLMLCRIRGFQGGDYESCRLLVYKISVRTSLGTHYISATEPSWLMLCKI
jgi:hypothetical protein